MSRVINPNRAGKERNRLAKAVVIATRELAESEESKIKEKDLGAFIALTLRVIANSIKLTTEPWEKRGYWLKADRFRREWEWADKYANEMLKATLNNDNEKIRSLATEIAEKLSGYKVSRRHRMGKPWEGAWEKMNISSSE